MADAVLFRVHRNEILPALNAVFEAVDSRSTIPILANILLRPQNGVLHLRGTDLTVEIETSCDLLEDNGAEAITVNGEALREIVRNLPESAEISFTAGRFDGQVRIQAGKSKFSLLTLPEGDFPSIVVEGSHGPSNEIDVQLLLDALAKVNYAIKDDKTRPFLSGPYLHLEGEKFVVVGCDGHNLAVVKFALDEPTSFPGAILPLKTAKAIAKLYTDYKGKGSLVITDAMLRLSCGDKVLNSKLIDGTYPGYNQIIPQPLDGCAISAISALKSAVARVCLVAEDLEKDSVFFQLQTGMAKLTMSVPSGEDAEEEMPLDYDGPALRIGFNGKYIRAMLGSIATQDVELHFYEGAKAALFRPTIKVDEAYVLMPRLK